MLKPILIWILSCGLIVMITACSKNEDGGQDTGGGNVFTTSIKQTNDNLDLSIKLATESVAEKNVFVQFWLDRGKKSSNSFIRNPKRLFPQIDPESSEPNFSSPPLSAFARNRIIRLSSGDCPRGKDETTADASVTPFDTTAEICFSIGNLTNLAPSASLREILSLVLHEAIHMGGGSETEATEWQREFSTYFGVRFGDISKASIDLGTNDALLDARSVLDEAISLAEKSPSDPQVYGAIGRFSEKLKSLPDVLDPLALEIKLRPKHPELIDNYTNSVLVMLERIKIRFELPDQVIRVGNLPVPVSFMSPERVQPTLEEMSDSLDIVHNNFLAFLGDATAQSTCVVPQGTVEVEQDKSKKTMLFQPPRTCPVTPAKF